MTFYKQSLLGCLISTLLFVLSPTILGNQQQVYFLSKDGYALLKRAQQDNKSPQEIKNFLFRLPKKTFCLITPENSRNLLGITWQDSYGGQLITTPPPLLIIDLPGVGPTLFNAWNKIVPSTPLVEYTGTIITDPNDFRRNPYIMDAEPLNPDGTRSHDFRKIDALDVGNASRFARHLPSNEALNNYNIVNTPRESVATANINPVQDPSLRGRIFIGSLDNPIAPFAMLGYDFGNNEQERAPILFSNTPFYEPLPEENYWVRNRILCVINREHWSTQPHQMSGASVAIDGLILLQMLAANTVGIYTLLPSMDHSVIYRVMTSELIRLVVNEQRMAYLYIAGTEINNASLLEEGEILQRDNPIALTRNLVIVDIESTRKGERKTLSFPITIDLLKELENNVENGFRILQNGDHTTCLIPYPFAFMPTNIIDPRDESIDLYVPGMITDKDILSMLHPTTTNSTPPIDGGRFLSSLYRYLNKYLLSTAPTSK